MPIDHICTETAKPQALAGPRLRGGSSAEGVRGCPPSVARGEQTKNRKPVLTFDGHEVRARLVESRAISGPVHVDWLRFTVRTRHAPIVEADVLFPPPPEGRHDNWHEDRKREAMIEALQRLHKLEYSAGMQARQLACEVCIALGSEFAVGIATEKGRDFYAKRWPIFRNGAECGWIGFGASSDSPAQKRQSETIHCNLYGHACTFADHGWRERVARLIDEYEGWITRIDLALDAFDGLPGGMDGIVSQYKAGAMDVRGKRPKCGFAGDWANSSENLQDGRSFYIGSREAGKLTNVYTKGIEQFGLTPDAGDWLRVELRYGNKLRDIGTEALLEPASYFAGASDWHASVLGEVAKQISFEDIEPKNIACRQRLVDKCVDAAVSRVMRWASSTAGATFAFLVRCVPSDVITSVIETTKRPGRLLNYSDSECEEAINRLYVMPQTCPV